MDSPLLRHLFKPEQPAWPRHRPRKTPAEAPPAIVLHGFDSVAELEDVHAVCDPYGTVRMIHIMIEDAPPECPHNEKRRAKAVVYVYYASYGGANRAMAGLRKHWPDPNAVRWDSLFRRR